MAVRHECLADNLVLGFARLGFIAALLRHW